MRKVILYMTFTFAFNVFERSAFGMVKMAALAPKGVFEEEDFYVPAWEEPPYERHFDDYTRNCDEAA